MVAVRPTFHQPALLAKQAANIDHIGGGGRLSLNVVSSWWKMKPRSMACISSGTRIVTRAPLNGWRSSIVFGGRITSRLPGKHYAVDDAVMQPKPISRPRR